MTTRSRSLRPLGALLLAVLIVSCGDSNSPPRATTIQLNTAVSALDAIGATQQLTAQVLDQDGQPISGASVTWASLATSVATVSPTGLITSVTNGTAQVTATSGNAVGTANVTVTQVPVAPSIVSGNAQSGLIGTALAQPVVVRVVDRLNMPMAGRTVSFVVTSGSGTVGTPTATSGADGSASSSWTVGTNTAVPQILAVSVTGTSQLASVTATALAGPATAIGLAPTDNGHNQSAPIGLAVPVRPSVRVTDALGNGVAGASVTFAVTGGGGSVTGATATTDATGRGTVGSWILGPAVGPNTLQATLSGFSPVNFSATATLDPCTPAGAPPIVVGQTINGTLASTDCTANEFTHYDLYQLDLATSTTVIIGLTASFDAWLKLYNGTTGALIVEHDDIIPGVNQDSRIVITLAAGPYLIRARSFDPGQFGTYALSLIQAQPGVPAVIARNGGDVQVVPPNTPVPIAPSVIVRDDLGDPVAGAQVTFEIVPTVGSISGGVATTNAQGIATLGSWTPAAGANVLSATVSSTQTVSGNPVMFSSSGNPSTAGFNIDLKFFALPTLTQLQAFSSAAMKWESILTNNLPAQPISLTPGQCSGPGMSETIDDLAIYAILTNIDGPGGVLGSAGPCALRSGSTGLTALGVMRFDTSDLPNLEAQGRLNAVILHEMGHVLGIGTLWNRTGLLLSPSLPSSSGVDTRFTGVNSIAGFDIVGGSTYLSGGKVPVENTQGGAGTRDAHWRESVLQTELMTGFLNAGTNPLSMLTVRSMQDIGYTVNTAAAEPFFVSTSLQAEGAPATNGIHLYDDIWKGPRFTLDANGRIIGAPALPLRKR